MAVKTTLTPDQVEQFITDGYVILHDCFTEADAAPFVADAYRQLGYDSGDPSTWVKPLVFLVPSPYLPLREFSPRAWGGVCDLVGGEERLSGVAGIGQWVINFHRGRDEPWQPPSATVPDWHKDGNFFRHFLDSPEQGLLAIPIFSDIGHRGGGTFLAADSVPVVARLLRDCPEGIRPDEFDFPALVSQCRDFREVTGKVGDVVLAHPFLLHSFSRNPSGRPRFITNLCIGLKETLRFDRPDPADLSPVERAILRALGEERIEFAPAVPRERIEPPNLAG